MSSKWELDDGIKSIKSAWQREHTARVNLEKMLENAESENDRLRELLGVMAYCMQQGRDCDGCAVNGADGAVTAPSGCDTLRDRMRELGVEVDG